MNCGPAGYSDENKAAMVHEMEKISQEINDAEILGDKKTRREKLSVFGTFHRFVVAEMKDRAIKEGWTIGEDGEAKR